MFTIGRHCFVFKNRLRLLRLVKLILRRGGVKSSYPKEELHDVDTLGEEVL